MSLTLGPAPPVAAIAREDALAPLARRAAGGDRAATADLLRAVGPSLLRGLRAVLGAANTDLDDALQESLLGFLDALPAFRGETSVQRYALRIGIRTALAARRRARARSSRFDEHVRASEPLEATLPDPSEEALASRQRQAFRGLLDALPEVQAETLALRVVFDYSLEEVAEATGAPVNTVRSRLRLAREALRARIEADPELAHLMEASS